MSLHPLVLYLINYHSVKLQDNNQITLEDNSALHFYNSIFLRSH